MELDHVVLHVSDLAQSIEFYGEVLDFLHEGRVGPFAVLRVSPGLTLDLMQVGAVRQPGHLAFRMPAGEFDRIVARLRGRGIAYGPSPFGREGGAPAPHAGAQGMASALYFFDPDGHNLELRLARHSHS